MLSLLMQGQFAVFLLLLIALVLSLSFHEFGHALVAKWFGDDTAESWSSNIKPAVHIDPVGLTMVALIGIGYAKPVPTDPRNYRRASADLWVAFGRSSNESITCPSDLEHIRLVMGEWLARSGAVGIFHPTGTDQPAADALQSDPARTIGWALHPAALTACALEQRYRYANARFGTGIFLALVVLSLAGLPFLSGLTELSRTMLDWITLFN